MGQVSSLKAALGRKENVFRVLVVLVALAWHNEVVFCVVQIIAVYSPVTLVNAGGLCHGASVSSSPLTI